MRTLPLLFLLLLFGGAKRISDTPTSAECLKFHTGTFYDKHEPNVTIVRDEQFQTETDPDGKYMKMKITWLSDCTYQLKPYKTNSHVFRKSWRKVKVLTVAITECDGDSYKYSATSKAIPVAIPGVIVRKK